MPRAALSEDDIRAFRARTIEVATGLFADRGFDAVTMRAIANELGCSPMTPYRYFENKDEIFALVRADAFRQFAATQAAAAEAGATPLERLHLLGQAYVQFGVDHPDAYRIMFQLDQGPSESYPELAAQEETTFSYLVDAVAGAVGEGLFVGDPLTIAHMLWAHVHGLVSLHLAGKLTKGRSLEELRGLSNVALEMMIVPK